MYVKDEAGKLQAVKTPEETPFFQEYRKKFQEDKCEDGQIAKPRDVYAAELGGPYHTHVSYQDRIYIVLQSTLQSSDNLEVGGCLIACLTAYLHILSCTTSPQYRIQYGMKETKSCSL